MYDYIYGKLVLSNLKCYHGSCVENRFNFYVAKIIKRFKLSGFSQLCTIYIFHIFGIKLNSSKCQNSQPGS